MLDFLKISTRSTKRDTIEIYPKFIIPTSRKSTDLMIRGGDFYAIWNDEKGLWSTDEGEALYLIDKELDKYFEENGHRFGSNVKVMHMWEAESGMVDVWHKYCQKQLRDSFHMLDENLTFSNTKTEKSLYASKRLPYAIGEGDTSAYDRLMSVLYSEEERHKLEWAIGSIVSGESKTIQKFLVLYGAAGTGKSTVLNIIQQLFEGYYSVFDAKSLGSSSNVFALEAFKSNPLVAIQHDGDLSRIEDNTRLNSLVSHEIMTVNEKFRSTYSNRFKCFLFMGTNKPVKITDAKSGLIRRLIDVSPTGNKVQPSEYRKLMKQISFELGAIANHCKEVFLENPGYYDNYIPLTMLGASNDFFNFVQDSYLVFEKEDGTSLKASWEMYKTYCEEAKVPYPLPQRLFKEELKNYFSEYKERFTSDDGTRIRSWYSGFLKEKFESNFEKIGEPEKPSIIFKEQESILDKMCSDYPAQYANDSGTPTKKWSDVTTVLKDLDTKKLHYLKLPENHIVIDFDIPDENGNKSFEKNLAEASTWPPTYAELSKSGAGIHLHYIYDGDPSKLSRLYKEHVEIKVMTGNSSLRRKLTLCNDLKVATIASGLPLKGDKVVNQSTIKSEKGLRTQIKKNLNKEIHPATKPSIDFIYKILNDAYDSGLQYDVTDMRPAVLAFAANSTNQADTCIKLVNKMHFKSENAQNAVLDDTEKPLVFYDVEVFPNLFLVNYKFEGDGKPVIRLINPDQKDIESLMQQRLVGFNCRRYDNHILYARLMGYSNEQLYKLSRRIISGSSNCFFSEAYNVSYTDVYDFSSKKQSLKKFEIELGIHHQELGLPWDEPVPEEMWEKVAEYCDNDVLATEAVFNARQADFTARQILADVAGMTVNDTTNTLTTRIIFGSNRKPQDQFNYRDMGDVNSIDLSATTSHLLNYFSLEEVQQLDSFTSFDAYGRPVYPGYTYDHGRSIYRDEEVGEGGYVYAEPGIYFNIALLDVASMHPHSAVAETLFGKSYTSRFKELLDARLAIKHKDFETAGKLLGGALKKYLTDEKVAKDLSQALKIAINSVYGLTAATFDNPFHDPRNIDNIVAKRGALFMINLKHEVQKRGFTVAHIKTDSIKIPDATPEIISFVTKYGAAYGYTFEHEATYDRMCLVNDAVYIAKYNDGDHEFKLSTGEKIRTPWTATGTQFQIPYVFKTLFSKSPLKFEDRCETKSVTSSLYLDMNEQLPNVEEYEKEYAKLSKVKEGETLQSGRLEELKAEIAKGHNYIFIGRVGSFCPIQAGKGGGLLCREKDGKYYAATGSKGYRWMEAEMVKQLEKEKDIDEFYYVRLVDEAIETISQYGDFEMFAADDSPLNGNMNIPEIPFN